MQVGCEKLTVAHGQLRVGLINDPATSQAPRRRSSWCLTRATFGAMAHKSSGRRGAWLAEEIDAAVCLPLRATG
jgi:hypothetical protein